MSKVKDTFFGGAAKKAGKASKKAMEKGMEYMAQQNAIAREGATRLYGGAQDAQRAGYQGALDIFGATVPQQANLARQGNVAAQQQAITGLSQVQAALLGQPINYAAMQPTNLQADTSFAQQQLPQTASIQDVIAPEGSLSPEAENVGAKAMSIIEAYNAGKFTRDQALSRLLTGNAPGKGNNFPGVPATIAKELLDYEAPTNETI